MVLCNTATLMSAATHIMCHCNSTFQGERTSTYIKLYSNRISSLTFTMQTKGYPIGVEYINILLDRDVYHICVPINGRILAIRHTKN